MRGFWFNLDNIPSLVKIIYYSIFYILHNAHFHFFSAVDQIFKCHVGFVVGLFSEFEIHHGKNMKQEKSADEESKLEYFYWHVVLSLCIWRVEPARCIKDGSQHAA
jgi:hypothetical protein